MEAFRRTVAEGGGPILEELDFSPESLVPVGEWVVRHGKLVRDIPEGTALPPWYEPGPPNRGLSTQPSPETLWLLDGLVYYFAECFLRAIPGLRWEVADEPRRRDIYVNQWWPVIEGMAVELNPLIVVGLTHLALEEPESWRPERLLEIFREYERGVTEDRARMDRR